MLAKELFDDEDAIIKIDMSEYSEKYNVSKMIGSAPGYVGYLEGGQLTEKVSKKPYCVLLFDEIEKAHPDIFDILLQVLDDGYLTDNRGKKVSFRNTIIIMTSNLGSSSIKNQKNFGFVTKDIGDIENNEKIFLQDVKKYFKVEFINRLDDIIVFNCLGKNELRSIIDIQIQEINERLKSRNISIKLDEKAIDYVLDMGYDKEYGARKLSRTIQNLIEYEIAQMILKKEITDGSVVNISKDKEKLSFEKIL
jgi:ATPase with chaperone activity